MKYLSTIAIAATLAACSGQSTGPLAPTPTPDGTKAPSGAPGQAQSPATTVPAALDVNENLSRLRALQVFEVEGVIENIPQEANCYNLACPGQEKAFASAKSAAAQKLAAFTDAVVQAAALPPATDATSDAAIAKNLDALRALQVVTLGDLIVEHPQATPNCYNLVCPADQAAADRTNAARAGKLATIAHALAR